MIRILLADSQTIFRAGLARIFLREPDLRILGECDRTERLVDLVASVRECVALVAAGMVTEPDQLFAAAIANGTSLLLITDPPHTVPPALLHRLNGTFPRNVSREALLHLVRNAAAGKPVLREPAADSHATDDVSARVLERLTPRDLRIVGFVALGYKNRQIAEALGTGEQVIKNYLRAIFDKTGSGDRLELALFTLHHRRLGAAAAAAVGKPARPATDAG